MTTERYHDLAGRLFDGELADGEAEDLARLLLLRPEWREDLSRQRVLWELWSQAVAPERSAEAFVAAWKERVAAEADASEFQAAVRTRLERAEARGSRTAQSVVRRWWRSASRPAGLVWAVGVAAAFALAFWFAAPRTTAAVVTIHGEAVCTACVLHEGRAHTPAIRVGSGDARTIYYLEPNKAVAGLQKYFCAGPTPAEATGREKAVEGRRRFEADLVRIPAAEKAMSKPGERILFPI